MVETVDQGSSVRSYLGPDPAGVLSCQLAQGLGRAGLRSHAVEPEEQLRPEPVLLLVDVVVFGPCSHCCELDGRGCRGAGL